MGGIFAMVVAVRKSKREIGVGGVRMLRMGEGRNGKRGKKMMVEKGSCGCCVWRFCWKGLSGCGRGGGRGYGSGLG